MYTPPYIIYYFIISGHFLPLIIGNSLKDCTGIRFVVFWSHLLAFWSPGTRSVRAKGALAEHVAPLSHTIP